MFPASNIHALTKLNYIILTLLILFLVFRHKPDALSWNSGPASSYLILHVYPISTLCQAYLKHPLIKPTPSINKNYL